MPLQKILLKPGVNRENTRYTNEGGYYESNLVRFRQGTPEKIGGWYQISTSTFTGICRSLWNWTTLAGANLIGVGTEEKFYIAQTGQYYDVTPIVSSHILGTNPFTGSGTTTVTVTDATYNPAIGDYVIFSGASSVGGVTISGQYKVIATPTGTTYTIIAASAVTGTGGGSAVYASYLLSAQLVISGNALGWGTSSWNTDNWGGIGQVTRTRSITLWTQYNFGENLLFGPKLGAMYMWNASTAPNLFAPTNASITNASPAVVTLSLPSGATSPLVALPDGTAIMFETTGALPTPLKPFTTYYTLNTGTNTYNLAIYPYSNYLLSGVAIIGTAGQFSCDASSYPLVVGQTLVVSGGFNGTVSLTGNRTAGSVGTVFGTGGGTIALSSVTASGALGTLTPSGGTVIGSINGYVNPTTYYIVATNGSTTFTLSTTLGGSGVTTVAGTTSLTYTVSTLVNTSSVGSGTHKISTRAIPVSALASASNVPLTQNTLLVSDASRFTFAFGTNDYLSTTYDPMLVRWSDQESLTNWTPAITNQSGSLRLSHGSNIQAVLQSRQEVLVFTDAALYSLQYLGAPYVWGSQILSDNISIVSINAAAYSNGVAYWMGQDKFYKYDGRVQTLRCDLRQFIYDDINRAQFSQIFASTNEGFNEVWWFYCTQNSTTINRYVVYNYVEDVWYYGGGDAAAKAAGDIIARTAWLDSSLLQYPIAATYSNNLVYHEYGVDDGTTGTLLPIDASITTSQFDIGDGHNFAFVWRMLPDLTFRGSTDKTTPSLTIQLLPLQNSGSGYNDPKSLGGTSSDATQTVTATQTYPIDLDTFTGQLNIRVRGRQMSMKIRSNTVGTQWQLGAPRIDIRPDGRRGG